jgi:hypothetical protein
MKAGAGRRILEKTIKVSGAVARSLIGLGAIALLFIPFRKKKTKKKDH